MKINSTLCSFLPLAIIIVLAALFRFSYLDRIPNAITGDELVYPLTAKSVVLTGHDMTGTWNILESLIFRYPPNQQQAELPYFLHLPFSGLFPFSLFMVHLPFAILSVGIVILLYLISDYLFGRPTAIATGFVAAINPWLVVMGRTGYESTPATFFYLLALLLILEKRSWKILWAVIPLLLGFYSYIGTKIILLPFVLISIAAAYRKNKLKSLKEYFTLFTLCVFIVVAYIVLIKTSSTGTRITDLFLPSDQTVVHQVNEIRKNSLVSPFTNLLVNKFTVYSKLLAEKLIRIFSLSYLFIEGDLFFPIRGHSFFYMIDSVCIALGVLFLFAKRKIYFLYLTLFVLIGTFPHLFFKSSGDFSGHLAFMFPFLILFAGIGIKESLTNLTKRWPFIIGSVIAIVYLYSAFQFGYIYFYEHPLQDFGSVDMRVLSRYLVFANRHNQKVIIYSPDNVDFFQKYLFYSNSLTKKTVSEINDLRKKGNFSFHTVNFLSCETTTATDQQTVIRDLNCFTDIKTPYIAITQLSDAGEIYRIYNDSICSQHSLKQYPSKITLADLNVERLTEREFCETYVSKFSTATPL